MGCCLICGRSGVGSAQDGFEEDEEAGPFRLSIVDFGVRIDGTVTKPGQHHSGGFAEAGGDADELGCAGKYGGRSGRQGPASLQRIITRQTALVVVGGSPVVESSGEEGGEALRHWEKV